MNRRSTLFVLLLFLLPLTVPLIAAGPVTVPSGTETTVIPLLTDTPSSAQASPTLPAGPTQVAGQYEYDGLGAVRSTQEYALGTNTSLTVTSLNYSAQNVAGGMRLPAGWTGYRMQANISNLYDQLYWVSGSRENGNFASGGSTPTNWTRVNSGTMGTNGTYPLDGYGCNYGLYGWGGVPIGYSGSRGVQAWVEFDDGWPWDTGKYVAWENTVAIPRDSPTYARLTFRYQVDSLAGSPNARGRMVIYVYVAGKTYSQIIAEDEAWHQVTVSIPDDDLTAWPQHGSILVRLGFSFTGTQSAWDYECWGFNFDDVTLEVRGKAQPQHTWLQLWMNSTAVSNGASYGLGTVTVSGTWVNPGTTPLRVIARWYTQSSSSVKVDFTYNLTLYIRRTSTTGQQTPPHGTSFLVRNQLRVYWTAWFYAYQPYYFQRYNLTVQRPTTDTWLYKVTDPLFNNRNASVQTNSTHFLLSSTTVNDVYGWWNFTLQSTNRVSEVKTNAETYRVAPGSPSQINVTATLISGTTSGEANLTIYKPDGSILAGSEQCLDVAVTGTTVKFALVPLSSGATAPAGQYTICVTYDDDTIHDGTFTATRAGFYSKLVVVQHATNLWGDPASLQVTYGSGYFYPRVRFNDTDTSTFIGSATVTGNWTATTPFYQSGGFYEVQFDASGKVPGDYVIGVNASKTYYDSKSCYITVQVRSQSSLSSPQSPGLTKPYNEITTVQVKYADGLGAGIAGATVTTDWPGNPVGVTSGTAGWYNIQINTASQPRPATYSLTITAQKLYYQTQILTLTIIVRERDTSMSTTAPTTVPINEYSRFNVTLTDLDAGSAILNSSSKVHLELWRGGTNWISAQWANYSTTSTPGRFRIGIDTSHLSGEGTFDFVLNFKWYGTPNNQPFHGNRTATVYVGVRKIATSISYTPPDQTPWGNNLVLSIRYFVDDSASSENTQGLTGVSAIGCTLDTTPLVLGTEYAWSSAGSGYYTITIYASKILAVKSYTLVVSVTAPAAKYADASRGLSFTVRRHHTQVVVDPPAETLYLRNTNITLYWYDLDSGGALIAIGSIYQVTVSGYGSPQVFTNPASWTLVLVTNTWTPGSYSLNLAVTCDVPPDLYDGANSGFPVRVRIHYTSIVVQPPAQIAWGKNTTLVIQWTDLDVGGAVGATNASRIDVVTPFGNQTFNNPTSLTLVLKTDTWSISSYGLTVYIYAKTSPQKYSNANGGVTVVIRIHRVEVVVPTPAPTPWGSNTGMVVTWRDLDTNSTIAVGNLKNITITNGPTGTQYFTGSFTFNLVTSAWSVGSWSLTITVYPTTSPQRYEVGSAQVSVTIRAHYVSVTVDPPQAQPKGSNTPLVVHWRDVDTSTEISQSNLLNVTVKGTAPGLPYMAVLLSFNLPTSSWSVGGYNLNVWVYANSNLYGVASGPVLVTIRAHATRLDVVAPSATPWGHYTRVELRWWDLDASQYISGNLKNITVSNCPDFTIYTYYSLIFDLDTRAAAWAVGGHLVTVTLYSSSGDYQNAGTPMQVTIRIHYTNVVVQPPSPTPWGTNTPMTVEWRDLDEGNIPISPSGNLVNVTVRKSGTTPQSFVSLAFTLVTSSMPPWNIGSHTLNVTIYAVSTGRKYSDQWSTTSLTIRAHRVNVIVTPPPAVPYEGSFSLVIQWKDIDTTGDVSPTYLYRVYVTGNYTGGYPNLPRYEYSLSFGVSAVGWARVVHLLNVTVYPTDTTRFDTQWATVIVLLRKHSIVGTINPIPGIPYSNNTWLTLRVNDSDTGSLLSGKIAQLVIQVPGKSDVTYNSANWVGNVINMSIGVYRVRLQCATWTLGSYSLHIVVDTTPEFYDGSADSSATIRQLYTAFTYVPPSPVPWNENGNLTVTYRIDDPESDKNTNPLTLATVTIVGYTQGVHFFVTGYADGTYAIRFTAAMLGNPGLHAYTINIVKDGNHKSGQLIVTMTVRRIMTVLSYTQLTNTPYGNPVLIRVSYTVSDGESAANGNPVAGATITITGVGFTVGSYSVAEYSNYYLITINDLLNIGPYQIRVDASSATGRYNPASINNPPVGFTVRSVYMDIEKTAIEQQAYGEAFIITVIYRVRDDASSQDTQGIPSANQIVITTNGSFGFALTPSDYTITQPSPGYYRIVISSTKTPYPGRWWVNITIGWIQDPPNYQERWITAWLTTTQRPTLIQNTYPPNTGYAELITVYLNYTDVTSSWGIDNSTTGTYVRILVLNATTHTQVTARYWIEKKPGSGGWMEPTLFYRIYINASQLGVVNVMLGFEVRASWVAGNPPYYAQATSTFTARILGTETLLYADAVETMPSGDDIAIVLHYNTTAGLSIPNGTGLVGISVKCDKIPGWDHSYWWVGYTHPLYNPLQGRYVIIINGAKNLPYGSYTFSVNLTWPTGFLPQYAPYYASANALVSARVRIIQTTLDWSQPDTVYYGQQLTLYLVYEDYDHIVNITGASVTAVGLTVISTQQLPDMRYKVVLSTSSLNAGPISFILNISKANYLAQFRDIDINVNLAPLTLTRAGSHTTPSITVYYGEIVNVTVLLEYGLSPYGPVLAGVIQYKYFTQNWAPMTELGNGYYYAIIDTGAIGATGTQILVQVNMANHDSPILLYTLSVLQIDTRVDVPAGDSTARVIIIDYPLTIFVTYVALHPVTGQPWYNITGANVIALNGSILMATFSGLPGHPGTYNFTFPTSTWPIGPVYILISALSPNTVQRTLSFAIQVLHKPCNLEIVGGTTTSRYYDDSTSFTVYLSDPSIGPISGHNMSFVWQGITYPLFPSGTPGYYLGSFLVNAPPRDTAYALQIRHETFEKYGYNSTTLQVLVGKRPTRIDIIEAYTISSIDGVEYRIPIPIANGTWRIPIRERLVFVVRFSDYTNVTLTNATGAEGSLKYVTDYIYFTCDPSDGFWRIAYDIDFVGTSEPFRLTFTRDSFLDSGLEVTLVTTNIPVEVKPYGEVGQTTPLEFPDILYVSFTPYVFLLYANDTYHNIGIRNAILELKLGGNLPQGVTIQISEDKDHPGYYVVSLSARSPCAGTMTFTTEKTDYAPGAFEKQDLRIEFSFVSQVLIAAGSIGGVALAIALIGWALWARVFSIPWEVRRMRSLAKKVGRDQTFELSGKDRKHFRAREVKVEDTVGKAMTTIGVPVTAAMLPTTTEVAEVSATEEDLMGELDKIPGLGPDEKAVLAQEMRKIPRKDRIWFLDDLRRQMGERRMDFLTTKTPTPAPAPTVRAAAAAKPALVEAPKPVTAAKPGKPKEKVEKAEKPEKPKERVAPTVRPREEHVAPPPTDAVEVEIRRELDKIPGLTADEKNALLEHLKYLTPEERRATYQSLRQTADK